MNKALIFTLIILVFVPFLYSQGDFAYNRLYDDIQPGNGSIVINGNQSGNFTAYVLVEEKTVTGSAVTTLDFDTVLDGDTDGGYKIEAFVQNPTGSANSLIVRINGANSTVIRQFLQGNGGSVGAARSTDVGGLGFINGNDATMIQWDLPFSKTGNIRYFSNRFAFADSSVRTTMVHGVLSTPAQNVNIVSMGIAAVTPEGLGVNTTIRLFRIETVSIGADGAQGPPGINGTGGGNGSWNTTSLGILTDANITQFFNSTGGIFNIRESWLGSLFCLLTGCTIDGDLNVTGDVEAGTFTLNGTTISDWSAVNGTGGIWTNVSGVATFQGGINVTDSPNIISMFFEDGYLVVEG